ncbi:DUF3048 domain-containing protein [Patescibacteria group bacterium]|nr:DUF3048 domain-containing protein [Patescibacteria group bacterium]MBU1721196.1 DUF3048 domain-containing protein [Patescibacteria group bacterium]MBU1901096.1 DUF3048 domain-containing protein [Patescibacteria group bacterium]
MKIPISQYTKKIKQFQKSIGIDSVHMVYVLAGFVLFVALGLVLFLSQSMWSKKHIEQERAEEEFVIEEELEEIFCDYERLIDGVCVEREEAVAPGIVGVMIENHVEARPLAGLSQARVVYEAAVEGNITRFFALFIESDDVVKVGPVRSARPYYIDWLSEYGDTMYMHVGGSPEALEKIAQTGIFDMNEFSRGWYFWRSRDRAAPHNVYTSSQLWQDAYETYAPEEANTQIDSWKFDHEAEACQENCLDEITVAFAPYTYRATWMYNAEQDLYERYEGGRKHYDQTGGALIANTVIVEHVSAKVIDNVGRLRVETLGEGDVDIFMHGKHVQGTWKKENRTDKTRWYDDAGEEISIVPGVIWVSVLSQLGELLY